MNIYIYGNKNFANEINSLLLKSNIKNIEHLKSLKLLKNIIKEYSDEIFIIDDSKIIKNEFLYKINPFKSKDLVSRLFLDKYGIEDVFFNSLDGLVKYILLKIDNSKDVKIEKIEEIEEIEEKEREILSIDDIYDVEMAEAISDLNTQEKKKD